jgi:Spy/CpxP family protein refolding chaperone
MKKIVLLALVLFSSTVIFAQSEGRGNRQFNAEESAKRQTEWMKKELKLTETQIAPVDSINLLYAKKQQELFQNRDTDRDKRRQAFTELTTKKNEAFAKVLTKEQLETYKKKSEEMLSRRQEGNGANRPGRN